MAKRMVHSLPVVHARVSPSFPGTLVFRSMYLRVQPRATLARDDDTPRPGSRSLLRRRKIRNPTISPRFFSFIEHRRGNGSGCCFGGWKRAFHPPRSLNRSQRLGAFPPLSPAPRVCYPLLATTLCRPEPRSLYNTSCSAAHQLPFLLTSKVFKVRRSMGERRRGVYTTASLALAFPTARVSLFPSANPRRRFYAKNPRPAEPAFLDLPHPYLPSMHFSPAF